MSKWIDFSLEERKAMLQGVVEARQIDESAAENLSICCSKVVQVSVKAGTSSTASVRILTWH